MSIRTTADLGALVRERRVATGTTQADLARRAGVGRGFLVRLEQGHPGLEIGRVLAVLEALDLTITAPVAQESGGASAGSEALLNLVFDSLDGGDDDR